MKTLKNVAIILLGIIVLVILVGYFLPRKIHLERSISIKTPVAVVFEQVNTLQNWVKWSPWYKLDTAMNIRYDGISGKGASYSWESENKSVGQGTLTITESKPGEFIATEMNFRGREKSAAYFRFELKNDSTRVVWGFDTDLGKNPFMRYMGGMMKRMVGSSYEKGLASLKDISIEAVSESHGLKIALEPIPLARYFGLSVSCLPKEMEKKIPETLNTIVQYLTKNQSRMIGPPIIIYRVFTKNKIEFDAGVPYAGEIKASGKFKSFTLPKGDAVVADFYGAYQKVGPAYESINNWISANKKTIVGPQWEEYITDPVTEKDTSKWLTRIFTPVK